MKYCAWCFHWVVFAAILFSLYSLSCSPTHTRAWYQETSFGALPDSASAYLQGMSILIDPGHGGAFSGAIGPSGLKEKDINLKVALLLCAKLQSLGAKAFLTRDSDSDLLVQPGAHSREDLLRRTTICDSLHPDLFISLHHNADESSDKSTNCAKVFYKLDDVGPSFDAALAITQSFSEHLGLGIGQLTEGNYFVLRNASSAAVLCEPSYLSNPDMERILKTGEAVEVEAETYLRGIVAWCSRGIPRILDLRYDANTSMVIGRIACQIPLDTLGTVLTLDGNKLEGKMDSGVITAALPRMQNGIHVVRLTVANLNGNTSLAAQTEISIDRPPASLHVLRSNTKGPEGTIAAIQVIATDSYGFPVRDGISIRTNTGMEQVLRNGRATFYIPYQKRSVITFTCGTQNDSVIIETDNSLPRPVQGFISNASGVKQAGTIAAGNSLYASDENGFFSLTFNDSASLVRIHANGYIDTSYIISSNRLNCVVLRAHEDGILFGKRIVIDPEFGGTESGGHTHNGIRACDITRKTALYLHALLQQAGAEPVLARIGDHSIFPPERIRIAEQPPADLYIQIKADSLMQKPYVGFYPGSRFGGLAADCIAESWNNGIRCKTIEIVNYVLQQTQCTALSVSLIPLYSQDPLNRRTVYLAAESMYHGIVCFFKSMSNQGSF